MEDRTCKNCIYFKPPWRYQDEGKGRCRFWRGFRVAPDRWACRDFVDKLSVYGHMLGRRERPK